MAGNTTLEPWTFTLVAHENKIGTIHANNIMWFKSFLFWWQGKRHRALQCDTALSVCLCVFVAYWTLKMRIVAFTQVDRYFPSVNCMQSADNKPSIAQRVKRAWASLFCSRRKRTGHTLAAFIRFGLNKKHNRYLGFLIHYKMNWDNRILFWTFWICFSTGIQLWLQLHSCKLDKCFFFFFN